MILHDNSYNIYYLQTTKVRRTLVGNVIVDRSDVVGACVIGNN